MREVRELVARIVEARSEQFAALEALEAQIGHDLDVAELEAVIDCEYSGRKSVVDNEAHHIVTRASRRGLSVVR